MLGRRNDGWATEILAAKLATPGGGGAFQNHVGIAGMGDGQSAPFPAASEAVRRGELRFFTVSPDPLQSKPSSLRWSHYEA